MFILSNFHTKSKDIKNNYDFNKLAYHSLTLSSSQV